MFKRAWLGATSVIAAIAPGLFTPRPGVGHAPYRRTKKKQRTSSSQKGAIHRLHAGRSSSVKKLTRWHRNGTLREWSPSLAELRRHAWYRRQEASHG